MIELSAVTFTYDGAPKPALRDVDLRIDEGEFVLVVGSTGAGKSTLLGTLNGLVPHFTGGHLDGTVTVGGIDTRLRPPREFAHLVGVVGQDPLAGFVTDTVEEELAYGMEQLGVEPQVMRRRVEETLDLLGIANLRRKPLRSLSGGLQQRVAIGSVLTSHPQVLVLDEPTSALDPTAAEEILSTLTRLVHDLGTTVVLAEHRMERVLPFADRLAYVTEERSVVAGDPRSLLHELPIVPPLVELGRRAGWDPLPLTVREARRIGRTLRSRLDGAPGRAAPEATGAAVLAARKVVVRYGSTTAVRGVDLELRRAEVVALMGRNGSGKSSLLWALQGSGPRESGTVSVASAGDPASLGAADRRRKVGLVPQTASDLLYLETVDDECAAADRESDATSGSCLALLRRIAPDVDATAHPRDLSEGQRLALVLAIQLSTSPPVMLLDEPTRGLDYKAKQAFAEVVRELAESGSAVVIATHDVEFVAASADRVAVMAEGEVVSDGDVVTVLAGSPAFAPQVSKVLGSSWLTVSDVQRTGLLAEQGDG